MPNPEFKHLKITGDTSIEPVTESVPNDDALVCTIIGPTGSGKSRFIEALAGDSQDLGISKDQLAGYTQVASAYRLVNVWFQKDATDNLKEIYLLDTPGFSDPKISLVAVLNLSSEIESLKKRDKSSNKLLFLMPINETRLPGNKRRTIEMLDAVYEPSKYRTALTVVTTMWDTLCTESSYQRAESNFTQLAEDIFKEFLGMGATMARFTNNKDSALHILDMGPWDMEGIQVTNESAGQQFLYRDLHTRIESALQQKKTIESELAQPGIQNNPGLKSLLEENYKENEALLAEFVRQFVLMEFPPEGWENAHYYLFKSLLGTYIPRTLPMKILLLRCLLTRLMRTAKRRGARKRFKGKLST